MNVVGPAPGGPSLAQPPILHEPGYDDFAPQWRSVFFAGPGSLVTMQMDKSCSPYDPLNPDEAKPWTQSKAEIRISWAGGPTVSEQIPVRATFTDYGYVSSPLNDLLPMAVPQQRFDLAYRLQDGVTGQWTVSSGGKP